LCLLILEPLLDLTIAGADVFGVRVLVVADDDLACYRNVANGGAAEGEDGLGGQRTLVGS
jgi:hypothetical protein